MAIMINPNAIQKGSITKEMLTQGARRPIILTSSTTEVDEETYQKLLSADVDVVFKEVDDGYYMVYYVYDVDKNVSVNDIEIRFVNTLGSIDTAEPSDYYFSVVSVKISKNAPHTVISEIGNRSLWDVLDYSGYLNKSTLSLILQQIDLTGTDAERKAKLDQFEAHWKALTGASDLGGARFVGRVSVATSGGDNTLVILNKDADGSYSGLSITDTLESIIKKIVINSNTGSVVVIPIFSHLEPVEIFSDNSAASKQKNLDNLNAYKANLEQLGISNFLGINIPVKVNYGEGYYGFLTQTDSAYFSGIVKPKIGEGNIVSVIVDSTGNFGAQRLLDEVSGFTVSGNTMGVLNHIASLYEKTKSLQAFGAIELKASDNAANKAALTAYKKILTYAGIRITNGYSVPVRITGNTQEYHGMLNIGTGALLSGIVTDTNETHHYPFNVSTADGAITFDANNYFLEKTSNEVTEILDAIKYSYTPVPLTATTSTNKTQLDLFLSKVPNAQVMHCTYKDVYAGTLHKIGTDWFGLLVKNTNNYEDALQVKLQADGTLIEGTTSLSQVNAKLTNIIG